MKKLKFSQILAWTGAFMLCTSAIAQTNAEFEYPVSASPPAEASMEMEAWDCDEGQILMVSVSEDENSENGQIEIYTSQGNTKIKSPLIISDGFGEVDISKLPAGFYIVVMECNGKIYKTTVVVNKY